MNANQRVLFLLALVSSRIFFLIYKDLETGEGFTDTTEYTKEDKQIITGNITLNDLLWKIVLTVSKTPRIEAVFSPSLSLSAEQADQFRAILPSVNAALPCGVEAVLHSNRPEFIATIRDLHIVNDENDPYKIIGTLLTSSAACIKTLVSTDYRLEKDALTKEITYATQDYLEYIALRQLDYDDPDLSEDEDLTDLQDSEENLEAFFQQVLDEGFYPDDEKITDNTDSPKKDIRESSTELTSKEDDIISLFKNHLSQ